MFTEMIILFSIPYFSNPCTALTIPCAIARSQLIVHHPMNSGVPFHKQHIIYSDKTSKFADVLTCLAEQAG